MTFTFFAGRSSLRRLHQTVQRNISRQHRNESSKSKPSSDAPPTPNEAPPFSGSYWAWIEPVKIPFRGYAGMQSRSPLLTQWESTLIIYFLGDLSAQTVQTKVFTTDQYEPRRALNAMIIGGISSIPSYKWFLRLGRHFNYSSHLLILAAKIVFSQMVFTPIFDTYFFGMHTLLAGGTLRDARERVVKTVPTSFVNSWKGWPLVTAFTFTFVRPVNRSVVAGVVAIGWQTYLSWLNRDAEAEAKREVKGELEEVVETKEVVHDLSKRELRKTPDRAAIEMAERKRILGTL
ncbi:hypothetical protein CLAFUW4_09558 [Fulvia fulva]|uniref:Uncharacterized protein n=1 Tax=Passalora fulva TaxID=5499 RepID=A0A9Q8PFC5_PASFU|nr:uncharacterized protein CLAFUR5_09653 [Fulvia fulva]KAK4613628.1 hypothetical protein CLAFUR4_09564 [Fulvia fulva]KAK4614755.1 hypothetical protein CLAFUR0_09555 [Fulvia fulva]UJO21448.1 hypothetical protein CLAFUR5_09653 [Fulvia fulva]WPV20105.1 hypothetical protein CLAFUW4_09558 [Fulvia fulva]WPV34906.1 hypothetical protein CLAFUW7_09559 [Fulvia fulva]